MAPVAPGRVLDGVGLGVRDAAATLDLTQRAQELLFLHRACGGIDRRRLLSRGGRHGEEEAEQRERAKRKADARKERAHDVPSGFVFQASAIGYRASGIS